MPVLIAFLLGFLTGVKRVDPINKANDSNNQSGDCPPVVRAVTVHIPPEVENKQNAKDRKKYVLDFCMAGVHTLTMIGVIWYAILTSHMLDKMKESTDAATKSANTAQKQLELAERPWISVTMTIDTPFIFDANGADVGLKVVIKNIGHSPATRIWPDAEMVTMPFNQTTELLTERDRFCSETKKPQTLNPHIGDTLSPGEDDEQHWLLHIKRADVERAANRDGRVIMPVIIACVPYHSTFTESTYLTAKIREIVSITEEGRGPVVTFQVKNGATPLKRLELFSRLLSANYAE